MEYIKIILIFLIIIILVSLLKIHISSKKLTSRKKNFQKIIINIALTIFLICTITCLYNIVKWIKDNNNTQKILNEISTTITVEDDIENNSTNESQKYTIDFEKLKTINSDTVGWLKVPGTSIEYPVVKATNNAYYLSHSFDKTSNSAGWIFADYRNKIDGTDKNIIIYGHNRRDGSMFATLNNILNESWYESDENRQVIFLTANGQYKYQVFAVYQVNKDNYDATINFNSNDQFINYIETALKRSIYDFKIAVDSNDNILTLSTCANNDQYRVVLHAKLLNN